MLQSKIDELTNRIEILDAEIERLDKKQTNKGLTVDEDHALVKAIFEQMELQVKLNHAIKKQIQTWRF